MDQRQKKELEKAVSSAEDELKKAKVTPKKKNLAGQLSKPKTKERRARKASLPYVSLEANSSEPFRPSSIVPPAELDGWSSGSDDLAAMISHVIGICASVPGPHP